MTTQTRYRVKDRKKDRMLPSEHDQLRDLLNRHAKALREEAIQTGGQVTGSQLDAVGRLARLVELSAVTQSRLRWPGITLFVTLVIVSILFFARVSTTEIELDLSVAEVSFRLPQQQVLSNDMRLAALGVSGLQQIQLLRSGVREARLLRASGGYGAAIRLSTGLDSMSEGSVTLAALSLPAGIHLWLRPTETPEQYRLSLQKAELLLPVAVNGTVNVGLPGMPPNNSVSRVLNRFCWNLVSTMSIWILNF